MRRAHEELGLDLDPAWMRAVLPDFSCRAVDAVGIIENELCPVVRAVLPIPSELVELNPDPDEVEKVSWVGWQNVRRLAHSMTDLLSPWAVEQVLRTGVDLPA